MSATRACIACRTAKARCDLQHPRCGRCNRRGIQCDGMADSSKVIFRDERVTARRNSERARRSRNSATAELCIRSATTPASPTRSLCRQDSPVPPREMKQLYPWLSQRVLIDLPEALKQDPCDRAVDRFFFDWTIDAAENGSSPGFLHNLPELYSQYSQLMPDSALTYAVRAIATANKPFYEGNQARPAAKARQHYGLALARLREKVGDEARMINDCSLVALLLLTTFELVFLSRPELLGPHGAAMNYILKSRGPRQFLDSGKFGLWRTAYDQVVCQQIMDRADPAPEQIEWLGLLDTTAPDLHFAEDMLRANVLVAQARRLMEDLASAVEDRAVSIERCLSQIQSLLTEMREWTQSVPESWQPKEKELDTADLPISLQPCFRSDTGPPALKAYRNLTVASRWTSHLCAQTVLRESVIDLEELKATLEDRPQNPEERDKVQVAIAGINDSVISIISSCPYLLGFLPARNENLGRVKGMMVGRLFTLRLLIGISKAKHAAPTAKATAGRIAEWISDAHQLL